MPNNEKTDCDVPMCDAPSDAPSDPPMCDAPSDAPMETLHISPHQILHNSVIFVLTNTVIYKKCLIFTQLMMVQVIMQPNNYCICTLPPSAASSAASSVKKFILCGILSQQTPNK